MASPGSVCRPLRSCSLTPSSPCSTTRSSACDSLERPSRALATPRGTALSTRPRPSIGCGWQSLRLESTKRSQPEISGISSRHVSKLPTVLDHLAGLARRWSDTGSGDTFTWPDVNGLKLVGYCDHFHPPMIGGSERVALEVYTAMRERGADISVLTALPGAKSEWSSVEGTPTWTHPMIDLTDVLKLQFGLSPGLLRRSLAIVQEKEPRVLHASSIHFQSARVAAATAKRTGLPLVTTAHVGSIEHLPLAPRLATDAYERSIGSRILAASTKVIAVSESVAAHVIELGASPEKVVVVPNGVDTNRFRPTDDRKKQPDRLRGTSCQQQGIRGRFGSLCEARSERLAVGFRRRRTYEAPTRAQGIGAWCERQSPVSGRTQMTFPPSSPGLRLL